MYVITDTSHYLSSGDIVYIDGNPSQTVGSVVYDEYDGAFAVDRVLSALEFTYKLKQDAVTSPNTSAGSVNVFIKSPVLKMYYGHQYIFDLSLLLVVTYHLLRIVYTNLNIHSTLLIE